jgi:hypothetical protein
MDVEKKATPGEFLYKFFSFDSGDYALSNLKESSFYMKPMSDFNDPFEGRTLPNIPAYSELLGPQYLEIITKLIKFEMLLPTQSLECRQENYYAAYETIRQYFEGYLFPQLKRQFVSYGITCFSKLQEGLIHPLANPLMWSHYADGFKGFCVEYKLTQLIESLSEYDVHVAEVTYSYERPQINMIEFLRDFGNFDNNPKEHSLTKFLATKNVHWKYENELRFISRRICRASVPYNSHCINRVIVSELAMETNINKLKSVLPFVNMKTFSIARLLDKEFGVSVEDGHPV